MKISSHMPILSPSHMSIIAIIRSHNHSADRDNTRAEQYTGAGYINFQHRQGCGGDALVDPSTRQIRYHTDRA